VKTRFDAAVLGYTYRIGDECDVGFVKDNKSYHVLNENIHRTISSENQWESCIICLLLIELLLINAIGQVSPRSFDNLRWRSDLTFDNVNQ